MSDMGFSAFMVMDDNGTMEFLVVLESFDLQGIALSAGVWVNRLIDYNDLALSISCPNATTTTTKQQIKTELLPDALQFGETKGDGVSIVFDIENIENYEYHEMDETSILVKVSEMSLKPESLIGAEVYINMDGLADDVKKIVTENDFLSEDGITIVLNNEAPIIFIVETEDLEIPQGVWFVVSFFEENKIFVNSLNMGNVTTIVPIKEKFIPNISYKKIDTLDIGMDFNTLLESDWSVATPIFEEIKKSVDKGIPVQVEFKGQQNFWILQASLVVMDQISFFNMIDPQNHRFIYINHIGQDISVQNFDTLPYSYNGTWTERGLAQDVSDATGETVTVEKFNELLTSLRISQVLRSV